ncbi:MAG: hypothetical protein PF440_00160 [Thiomicrorhabdus sp.]|jgi:hypothetical protein|nr:hypothetical protein [Thiomicrorhabdus sp.]
MLYKNDEVYRLTPADHKKITDKHPKFPIRLVYPAGRVRVSKSKHNTLPDKPNSISFPLVATVKTTTGAESWRYAENKVNGTNGRVIWSPHNLTLRGTMVLQKTDVELIYWLMFCCPYLEGGANFNGKVAKCVIEDLVGAAAKKAKKEEEAAEVKALIFSAKLGLGETKLRTVARAYFINDVEDLSYPQVQLAVENCIYRDRREGVRKFLEMVDAEQVLTVRGNLQSAIDKNIITFMAQKKMWAWVTAQGKKNEPIASIAAAADHNEALYDYYLGNRKFAQALMSALKGEKVIFAEGADTPDSDYNPEA